MYKTFIALTLLFLVACIPVETPTQEQPQDNDPGMDEPEAKFSIERTEGELVKLSPQARDPDNDDITYGFSTPFDSNGEWQTERGDEGIYYTAVTAEDGKGGRAVETVKVIITRANRQPTINCQEITVQETQTIDLEESCDIADEENDQLTTTYSGWMTTSEYTTDYNDAGKHIVTIETSDEQTYAPGRKVTETIVIDVQNTNRPPVFADDFPKVITATESDILTLPKDKVSDPDGDTLQITFAEPFNADGIWATDLDDAGEYFVDVIASDGEATAKRTVQVVLELLNTPPVLDTIEHITVYEGETVKLPISATDREGDAVDISISGWMTTSEYTTTYDDAGEYTVKVTATDGTFLTEQIVYVTVIDRNRPPYFVTPA